MVVLMFVDVFVVRCWYVDTDAEEEEERALVVPPVAATVVAIVVLS